MPFLLIRTVNKSMFLALGAASMTVLAWMVAEYGAAAAVDGVANGSGDDAEGENVLNHNSSPPI